MAKRNKINRLLQMPRSKKRRNVTKRKKGKVIHVKEDRYEVIIKDDGSIPAGMLSTVELGTEIILASGLLHSLIVGCARCLNHSQFTGGQSEGEDRFAALRDHIHQVAEEPFMETEVERRIKEQIAAGAEEGEVELEGDSDDETS